MKPFSAVALLLTLTITDCLGADRSRHRSGPIRSVPVAADIKRDVAFDCPEEFGYYPHPTDCSLYYVCVFGGALLESCTGGLMYSHELQTCDWPRNVGCDATSAVGSDDLERLNDRAPPPPPPPPRRTPPPPQQRAQPNPIVTSRGQPTRIKIEREPINDEYEKQQQLYAEVDDLPPIEELESDRQQRVYRGQPSTIGQVQKDRDGYVSQVNSGRTYNTNIIPASIPQTGGKIGSFSFGSQVDERRTSAVTETPQVYSEDKNHNMTDLLNDNFINTNLFIDKNDLTILSRRKRDLENSTKRIVNNTSAGENKTDILSTSNSTISKRSDKDDDTEYFEGFGEIGSDDILNIDDADRGKRQIRFSAKNHKQFDKNWANSKPTKYVDLTQYNYNPNVHSARYHASDFGQNFYHSSKKPGNIYSTANPIIFYQENLQSHKPFVPSLRDPYSMHNPINSATQIITKSPPISALKSEENPFAALAGGFYNNVPQQIKQNNKINHNFFQHQQTIFHDSSQLPSTVVTGKPIQYSTTSNNIDTHKTKGHGNQGYSEHFVPIRNEKRPQHYLTNRPPNNEPANYEEEYDSEEDNATKEEDNVENFKYDIPEPPYEFTHPSNKYANIDNPFANPDFDFDEFLDKLRDDHYKAVGVSTRKPKAHNNTPYNTIHPLPEVTTTRHESEGQKSKLNYSGMSTPRPFSYPTGPPVTESSNHKPEKYQTQSHIQSQNQYQPSTQYHTSNQNTGISLDTLRPKLKPANFKDERDISLTYNFNRPNNNQKPVYEQNNLRDQSQSFYSVTQKPYNIFFTSTGPPLILSTPKQQYIVKPEKLINLPGGKPYYVSTIKPFDDYKVFKQSTVAPYTTANQQLEALQDYWRKHPTTSLAFNPTSKPSTVSELPNLEQLFSQTFRPTLSGKDQISFSNNAKETVSSSTFKPVPQRRPIPKPSPEMNDYYYEDDEEPYSEPPVKSQYMPSSEIMPQRPPMAQNDQEYEDYDEDDSPGPAIRQPSHLNNRFKPVSIIENHNDISVATKAPYKEQIKMISVPVMVDSVTLTSNSKRPEISNYEIIHHVPRNKTYIRKPFETGPNTQRPPKYLNQTTLRPYTVRHRLAKTTTPLPSTSAVEESKQNRGKMRHQNLVAQIKATTASDQYRRTKNRHDDKLNSLEPTESVTPTSYSASPRPKMLYNGSQAYNPDQFDPYYAVYDEDGELYKDTDYVQQYNPASIRPAVQQTYRGTPPPARRPVETISTRPVSHDDYDDALIQGQINNQNQYRPPARQPIRNEGNELGYEVPSSVRTPAYEVTSISTFPSTTSTTTTTPRPTTALFTEAMTPSRYTPRLSNDENLSSGPDPINRTQGGSNLPSLTSPSPFINFSIQAKPFERTDNSFRLRETLPTRPLPTPTVPTRVTNKYNLSVEHKQEKSKNNNKFVSVTSGFSFRRNPSNSDDPYTLTLLTRPLNNYNQFRNSNVNDNRHNNDGVEESVEVTPRGNYNPDVSPDVSMRRQDVSVENEAPVYVNTRSRFDSLSQNIETTTPVSTTKYYLKTVIKRPAPFSNEGASDSTETSIDTEKLIEAGLQNAKYNSAQDTTEYTLSEQNYYNNKEYYNTDPIEVTASAKNNYDLSPDYTTSTTTTTIAPREFSSSRSFNRQNTKPSYYSYHLVDDEPDQTTEVFSGKVKNIIKAFFNNFSTTPKKSFDNVTPKPTQSTEEKTVNIGFHKKTHKYVDQNYRSRPNVKRLQIITEPTPTIIYTTPSSNSHSNLNSNYENYSEAEKEIPPTYIPSTTVAPVLRESVFEQISPKTTPNYYQSKYKNPNTESKFKKFQTPVQTETGVREINDPKQESEISLKFSKILLEDTQKQSPNRGRVTFNNFENDVTRLTKPTVATSSTTEAETDEIVENNIASTTSTTKATTTVKSTTVTTTKNLSFPTRASRVNPAIKLAAASLGSGRRSYQSTSNCSSENSLQPNPKCNEIKSQRPTSTRGRGTAHYSTSGGHSESQPQHNTNRGTPPTRNRPTLKPSTSIVSKAVEFVDIYAYPPSRPAPIYPTPTPDKTAAKCRKDVCQLPDCYCGGKDIPGDLPVEQVPQIVVLTFDDSVNDLNKGLYADLFEKGRVNPNGCPIAATFYVSHEWTDYSQVQNLYSAGHEMASHTVSHSFGEQFSQKKWNREVGGQREILAAYGGVKLEDVRGMRAPFLSVGGNKMFKMLYDSNFTYDSSLPVYENKPPSWPYTLDYKLFHDCMIPPCPTKSYPGVWEVPMVMWQDLNGGRCSMGDACANPSDPEGVYKMILKNFDRHYTTNRAPFGLYYHAAWFTQPHHKEGFIMFLDFINRMNDVWIVTNWQALQWVRDPTPINRLNNFQPFQCNYQDRPKKCNNPKVCNLWHKSGVRYMRTCQPCPEIYPWTGKTGIRSSRIDNEVDE